MKLKAWEYSPSVGIILNWTKLINIEYIYTALAGIWILKTGIFTIIYRQLIIPQTYYKTPALSSVKIEFILTKIDSWIYLK